MHMLCICGMVLYRVAIGLQPITRKGFHSMKVVQVVPVYFVHHLRIATN